MNMHSCYTESPGPNCTVYLCMICDKRIANLASWCKAREEQALNQMGREWLATSVTSPYVPSYFDWFRGVRISARAY